MSEAEALVDKLPFRDGEYRRNPYTAYDLVRPDGDVYRNPDGLYVVTRYDHISRLLRDNSLSVLQLDFGPAELQHHAMIGQDEPDHSRLRRATYDWFRPSAIERWKEWVAQRTGELFASAEPNGRIEAIYELAFPLTHGLMCHMLDIPWEGETTVRDKTFDFGMSLGPGANAEDLRITQEASDWFAEYIGGLIQGKRENPGSGMLDALIAEMDAGNFTEKEVIASTFLFFAVGHLDITYLLANGLILFAQHPHVLELYRTDASMRPQIINEMLRFDTPEQFVVRKTTRPTQIGETIVPAGAELFLMIGAANKDPMMFQDPHAFDVTRSNAARQLAFGGGVHSCVGQLLARATADVVFSHVATAFPNIRLDGPVTEGHTEFMRTFHRVPLRLR